MLKPKTKTSKGTLTTQHRKSQKKLNESKCTKSVSKKSEAQIRKNLQNTMRLLQVRLNIKKQMHPKDNLVSLSHSIYEIVQKNIPQKPKLSLAPTQDSSQQSSTVAEKVKDRQRSYSNHSSSIMEYFKQKFNDQVTDQHSVQKKLRALQALKKTQQFASKYNSQYNLSVSSIPDIGCDIGGKQVVIGKLKKKMNS